MSCLYNTLLLTTTLFIVTVKLTSKKNLFKVFSGLKVVTNVKQFFFSDEQCIYKEILWFLYLF